LTRQPGRHNLDVDIQIFRTRGSAMISQTAEYALRAAAALASHPDEPLVTARIAELTKVPVGYLAKVLQALGRAGLVKSTRGLHGGFVLARPADELTVYDVVQAVDPVQRIRTCPLGLSAHGARLCPLHRRLDDAAKLVEDAFRASKISELLAEPTRSKPLCSFPIEPRKG
jgi:Rrf2 family protein